MGSSFPGVRGSFGSPGSTSHFNADAILLGSFSLLEENTLREMIDLAHQHNVYVSTVSSYQLEVLQDSNSRIGRLGRAFVDPSR